MIRYQGGSLEAFQEIYAQLAPGVRRYLLLLAGGSEVADDLLQETFLQMHRSRAAYNPKYAVKPWVFGLARNVFLMNRRAARQWAKVHESREDLPDYPCFRKRTGSAPRTRSEEALRIYTRIRPKRCCCTMSGGSVSRRSPGCWASVPRRHARAPAGEWPTCAWR
jgi:DNA-directed RNA polymerase specialized sigma24 family protein